MKNLLIIGALGLTGTMHAQSSPETPVTPAPSQNADALRDTAPVKSVYDACLTTAGRYTWTALGLNADQMSRVSALQARYKEMMAPEEQPKKAASKSKSAKQKAAKAASTQVKDASDEKAGSEEQADASAPVPTLDPAIGPDSTLVAEDGALADLDPTLAVPLSVDDELQMILTPEQLELWNKRCQSAEPTGMVQP